MARKPTAEDTQETQPGPAEGLEAQVARLRADLSTLAETLAEMAQSRGSDILGTVKAGAEARAEDLREQAAPKLAEARAFVQDKPLTALGYALGAGVIFGLLFGRR